jgi:hypothetical protein
VSSPAASAGERTASSSGHGSGLGQSVSSLRISAVCHALGYGLEEHTRDRRHDAREPTGGRTEPGNALSGERSLRVVGPADRVSLLGNGMAHEVQLHGTGMAHEVQLHGTGTACGGACDLMI